MKQEQQEGLWGYFHAYVGVLCFGLSSAWWTVDTRRFLLRSIPVCGCARCDAPTRVNYSPARLTGGWCHQASQLCYLEEPGCRPTSVTVQDHRCHLVVGPVLNSSFHVDKPFFFFFASTPATARARSITSVHPVYVHLNTLSTLTHKWTD